MCAFIDGEDVANKPAIKENPVPIKKRKTAVESIQLVRPCKRNSYYLSTVSGR
jgi:hypothetical protein